MKSKLSETEKLIKKTDRFLAKLAREMKVTEAFILKLRKELEKLEKKKN